MKIFYINSIALFFTLFGCSLIGRLFAFCCPQKLKPFFNLFLSPVMGMAFLILTACLFGRIFPFNTLVLNFSFMLALLVIISFFTAADKKKLIQHAIIVGLFGLLCGLPLLIELFFYGGYNAHNDVYTYLAISDWLQSHAFNQTITPQTMTPAATQPAMYQAMGFRMGGSYFMGLLQAVFHIKWAYTIYPAAVLTPVSVCCLAMGFPIFLSTKQVIKRWIQLGLLILPALSFGALSFSMLYGFMSQTFGLALGAATLFWYGAMLSYFRTPTLVWKKQLIFSIPLAFFFSACAVSYSEISIFILLAIVLSTIVFMIKSRVFVPYIVQAIFVAILSLVLINFELPRIIQSILEQSHAVVGSPIDWPWFGFIFHMIGLHGGGWDIFQWSMHGSAKYKVVAMLILVFLGIIFLGNRKKIKSSLLQGSWLPSAIILSIFIVGIVYFRYFVANPFPVGHGQSWSQFKLSEWAFPFAFVFVAANIILLCRRSSNTLKGLVVLFLLLACSGVVFSVKDRMGTITNYYIGVKNLDQFYQDARQLILRTCPKNAPIYLNLINSNHNFRQMLSLYLTDRRIKSDWTGDGYVVNQLPENKRMEPLKLGDCLVQAFVNKPELKDSTLAIMSVSIVKEDDPIQLEPINPTYDQEFDNQGNSWYWVESSIKFKPNSLLEVNPNAKNMPIFGRTQLKFEYLTRTSENLFVSLKTKNGELFLFKIHSEDSNEKYATFQKVFNLPASQVAELTIHTDGVPTPLGPNDSRKASWMIRNLTMTPEK